MRAIRGYVSILLVLLFGGILAFEALGSDKHLADSDDAPIVFVEGHDSVSTSNEAPEDCSDPCHFGGCHFGHCSFTIVLPKIKISVSPYNSTLVGRPPSKVEAPFLEGPRRPPRIS